MKLSKLWNQLTRAQKREWSAWAKNNPLLQDDGNVRRVCGHKAMTIVLANRAMFGESANPTVLPGAPTWLGSVFSTRAAGVQIGTPGFVGFRVEQNVPSGTKWLVLASGLVPADALNPLSEVRYMTVITPGALSAADGGDLTSNLATFYRGVHGEFNPPEYPEDAEAVWNPARKVWFRLHQYYQGVYGPALVLSSVVDHPA